MNPETPSGIGICFDDQNFHQLSFVMDNKKIYTFFRLLQHGFFIKVRTEKTIKQLLCDQLELDPDYVINRIKTIFYNGKPVDDMKTAIVHDGATLALSAAMPGLVGATLRSGGVLSSFRSTISYRPDACETVESGEGAVYIKLFNLLVPEIGPDFLRRGIIVQKTVLDSFIKEQDQGFWSRCRSVLLDNTPIDVVELIEKGIPGSMEFIHLTVSTTSDQ